MVDSLANGLVSLADGLVSLTNGLVSLTSRPDSLADSACSLDHRTVSLERIVWFRGEMIKFCVHEDRFGPSCASVASFFVDCS